MVYSRHSSTYLFFFVVSHHKFVGYWHKHSQWLFIFSWSSKICRHRIISFCVTEFLGYRSIFITIELTLVGFWFEVYANVISFPKYHTYKLDFIRKPHKAKNLWFSIAIICRNQNIKSLKVIHIHFMDITTIKWLPFDLILVKWFLCWSWLINIGNLSKFVVPLSNII